MVAVFRKGLWLLSYNYVNSCSHPSPILRRAHSRRFSSLGKFTPMTIDIVNKPVIIEEISDSDLPTISNLLIKASSMGDGYGSNQFTSQDDVRSFLSHSLRCMKVSSVQSKPELLGIYGIMPSPITRSQKAFYCNNFILLDKAIRGRGVGAKMAAMTAETSYCLTRTVVTGKGITALLKAGWTCIGTIPKSVEMAGIGWVDDLLVCSNADFKKGNEVYNADTLPSLIRTPEAEHRNNRPLPRDVVLPELHHRNTIYTIHRANSSDLWEAEEIIRRAATEGDGFAIDEFTSEGHFNRSLFKQNHLVVVKCPAGQISAILIFGPSAVCRSLNSTQSAGYMIVSEQLRGQGLGSALLEYCLDNAPILGYKSLLVDVFCTSHVALGMLMRRGFIVTATLPNCGVVSGRGRTNSLLLYKQLFTS